MTAPEGFRLVARKRVEVLIDAAVQPRLVRRLEKLGNAAYAVLPAVAGHSNLGLWSREGGVGAAGRYERVIIEVEPDGLAAVLALTTDLIRTATAQVTVLDSHVLEPTTSRDG